MHQRAAIAEIVRDATELYKLEKKSIEKEGSWETREEHTIHFFQQEATTDRLLFPVPIKQITCDALFMITNE